MNTFSEIDLNNHNPSGVMAIDVAVKQLTLKEIGGGSDSQNQSPANSNSLHPPKLCDVDGCDNIHMAKGFCDKHYRRFRNNLRDIKANKRCACGCGQSIGYKSKYAVGHFVRPPHHLGVIGESNPNWKGGRRESKGYILLYRPEHPNTRIDSYVREHHLVVEKRIGRIIDTKTEVVHHINFIKSDNRQENLYLCDKKTHISIHKSIFPLIKILLENKLIEFDRKEGRYKMKAIK